MENIIEKGDSYDVAVIGGCGHVGLPLGISFAKNGLNVVGIDINNDSIRMVNAGNMPFLEDGAQELLIEVLRNNKFRTSDDFNCVKTSKNIIITAGTLVDKDQCSDLSQIETVIRSLIPHLTPGTLLVLRSTLAPNTTDYIKSFIESETDFKIGEDLFLSFAPERIMQGKAIEEISNLPQIIGAYDEASFRKSEELFSHVTDKDLLRVTPVEAELAKLFANSYRYVNFAIANEFAMIADKVGANIFNVVRAVNHDYPRCGIKMPGFSKGPCLGKDAWLLINGIDSSSPAGVVASSYLVNESIPSFLVNKVKGKIGSLSGKKVAVLGLAFKRDNDDPRDSLSLKLVKILKNEFSKVVEHDPYIKPKDIREVVSDADVIFVATNHSIYDNLDFNSIAKEGAVVVDVWNSSKKDEILYEVRGGN